MKKWNSVYLWFLIYFFVPQEMPAWSGNIHKLVTQSAILNSVLSKSSFLNKLNFERGIYFEMLQKENESKSIMDWVKYGSVVEDSSLFTLPHRSDNHFHNPLLSCYDYKFERIDAGEWRRIFVLSDSQFNVSWDCEIENVPFGQHSVNFNYYWTPKLFPEPSINNSLEFLGIESPEYGEPPVPVYRRYYPIFNQFRSIANCWDLVVTHNFAYPTSSTCAYELLNLISKTNSSLGDEQLVKDESGNSFKTKLEANKGKIYMHNIESRDSQLELRKGEKRD